MSDATPEMGDVPELSAKHRRFIGEYLTDRNGAQAAIRAGFSARNARRQAYRLLQDPQIRAEIALAEEELAATTKVTAERLLNELAVIAFSNLDHYRIDDAGAVILAADAPASAIRAISRIKHRTRTDALGTVTREIELAFWDKNTAIRNAGTHLGMFVERVEHSGEVKGGVLVVPGAVTAEQWTISAQRQQEVLTQQKTNIQAAHGIRAG